MIGNKDPTAKDSNTNAKDKAAAPITLRATYGINIIKNEFWGSDNPTDAYRELSIFMFPLPAKVFRINISHLYLHMILQR
jgi:hypothetical protein